MSVIHRSNLVGMGILPVQFMEGENAESLGLTGQETFSLTFQKIQVSMMLSSVTASTPEQTKTFKPWYALMQMLIFAI